MPGQDLLVRVDLDWPRPGVAGPLCSCCLATCLDSVAFTWTISLLMSLAKIRSVIGVATTSEITAASASRGSAINSSRFKSRVCPMLSTRNRSRFKMMKPQTRPPMMATASDVRTPSCSANIIERVPIPAVVSSTMAIWMNRARSVGICQDLQIRPPSQARKSPGPLMPSSVIFLRVGQGLQMGLSL